MLLVAEIYILLYQAMEYLLLFVYGLLWSIKRSAKIQTPYININHSNQQNKSVPVALWGGPL